jgi:dTDP-4-dehydrorhamnose 3,5-epimerase
MPFEFKPVDAVEDVILIEPQQFADDRGWFMETYKETPFREAGIDFAFVQDNHSLSRQEGVVRGLHYQRRPAAQGKLKRCIRGRILDVAVDIREGSPTYKEWVAFELSAENARQVWIPPGFANGFCTLTDDAEVAYKVTAEYDPELDSGFAWDDPEIGVDWPVDDPILSEKDQEAPPLAECDANFTYGDFQ